MWRPNICAADEQHCLLRLLLAELPCELICCRKVQGEVAVALLKQRRSDVTKVLPNDVRTKVDAEKAKAKI